jgi:hypothetical protein
MYGFALSYYQLNLNRIIHCWTPSQVALNQNLRSLWEQHIYWTRLTINSIVGQLPDEKETTARLLRNPTDFAMLLEPLYGSDIANRFARLFTAHLTIAAELVTALRDKNSAAIADAQKRWYSNADAIAIFLNQINPYWSVDDWRKMLYEHLSLTGNEAIYRVSGQYKDNIAINDQIEPQALIMADVMTSGIVQQFPLAFST